MSLVLSALAARRSARRSAEAGTGTTMERTLWHSPGVDLTYRLDGSPHARGLEAPIIKATAPIDPSTLTECNLVSSLAADGRHYPVLDLDYAAELRPSTRPGHFHLYLDKGVSWPRYALVLVAMAHAGLIEWAFVGVSLWRRMSCIRPPWHRKRMAETGREGWTLLARPPLRGFGARRP